MRRRDMDLWYSGGEPAAGTACRWPMSVLTIPVPLVSRDEEATIRLPRHMTESEWDQMLATLDVMKPALVE